MSHEKHTLEGVRQFVARYYEVDIELVTAKTDLDETLEGRSEAGIDWWEFVYYLGEEFGVDIPIEEVGTVGQVTAYIDKHRKR